jgi:hypothetical protein
LAVVGAVMLSMTTACAQTVRPAHGTPTIAPASSASAAASSEAQVYVAVLRRYLGTSDDNSFPEGTFRHIFILDRAIPGIGDPETHRSAGASISPQTQQTIVAALADSPTVEFVADRNDVIIDPDGCASVRDGGILITLAPPVGNDVRVEVGINGFVACLGATWLTYVVQRDPSAGWQVTGTTGVSAIA